MYQKYLNMEGNCGEVLQI